MTASHPRILLTPSIKTALLARKNANDPAWLALKAEADVLATYSIYPYTYANRTMEPDNTIFYDYQGSDWWDATLPLALAWQLTGDTKYSNKLLQLADEMIAAQARPENTPPTGLPPLRPDSYFPTRFVPPTLSIIYDWCYDQLGTTRKNQMVALANTYFDDMRDNEYEPRGPADGNYFGGNVIGSGFMGYATFGDNARAQEIIDYARIRFDGTPSALVTGSYVPLTHFDQCFEGGFPPEDEYSPAFTGAPFKGGFDFQGWAYGTGMYNRWIDYMLAVKTSTGEDLFAAHPTWLPQVLNAERNALFPDHFVIDPSGDWGGDLGARIGPSLPLRLAYVLAGTASGPAAQHFVASEISSSDIPGLPDFSASNFEKVFFGDPSRTSTAAPLPLHYSGFGPAYPAAAPANGAMPYFIMRSDLTSSAVWASLDMGPAFYGDHQHKDAGHFNIARGTDFLLVDAGNWKGDAGESGLIGSSSEAWASNSKNTLLFNDWNDYMYPDDYYFGGQATWGRDQVVAADETDILTYVRADLSTAYNRSSQDNADVANRKLEYFHRSFLYDRGTNLFVVYDEVKAKTSSNPKGPYRKHIRWHLPNTPTVNGREARVDQGSSRLYVSTILPANATVTAVNQSSNPDPCEPGDVGCTPFNDNSGTWRLEVRDPTNPLGIDFLTVLHPTTPAEAAPVSTLLTTNDGKMKGTRVDLAGGSSLIALFNAGTGQVPAPVTSTSYTFGGSLTIPHVLAGMTPSAAYAVTYSSGTVTVTQNPSGPVAASAAGVLRFTPSTLPCGPDAVGPGVAAPSAVVALQTICN